MKYLQALQDDSTLSHDNGEEVPETANETTHAAAGANYQELEDWALHDEIRKTSHGYATTQSYAGQQSPPSAT